MFILNFLDKDKEAKQKKNNNNIFRKQLFSQNIKSPKKNSNKNQINIKLNFNSEIINNNYNQQIDHMNNNNCNSSTNNNPSSMKYKQKTTLQDNNNAISYEDINKEKDKMISILQKELETNQGILIKLYKEKEDIPLSFCESEEIDNNRKVLTTKGSMRLTSSGKFNQLSSSNLNGFSSLNINKPVGSPRCFSSSLNFDSDSTGITNNQQPNNLLASSLSLGIFKTMRRSEHNTATNSTKNIGIGKPQLNKIGKLKTDEYNKANKLRIASSSTLITNSPTESLQSQCIALKQRTKRLLESYYSILVD